MSRRRVALAAGLVAAVAGAAVIAVLLLSSDDEPTRRPPAPVATATPSGPPRVVATIPYGSRPNAVIPTPDRVWVGAWRTGHLAAIDPDENTAIPGLRPASDGGTVDMVRAGGALWVVTRARAVLKLDPRTGKALQSPIPVTMDPSTLAVHGTDVYVGEQLGDGPPQIVRIDSRSGTVQATKIVSPNVTGMVYTRGRLWSLHGEPNHIVGRDPETLEAVRDVMLPGSSVGALAAGDGALWATIPDQDQLVRYDLRGGNRANVSVGARPIGVAVSGKRVWIAASGTSTLERVTTRGLRAVGDPIRVPLNPLAVAVSRDAVWVTCVGENVVARVAI